LHDEIINGMKIELSKIDATWLRPGLGCYVSINNSLIDVITPLNSTHESTFVDVPETGTLRLVIREMGKSGGNVASVSISLGQLAESEQWIDLIPAIDHSVLGKVLIKVLKDSNDELFMTEAHTAPETTSEVFFASEILSPSENCMELLKTSHFVSEPQDKRFQEVIDLLQKEIEGYKENIEMERESNSRLRDLVQGFLNSQESMERRSKERESALLELLDEKEEEIRKVMENHREIFAKVKSLELENALLKSKLQKEADEKKQMVFEVESCKKSLKYFEENADRLSHALLEVTNSHIEAEKSIDWSFRENRTCDSKIELETDDVVKKIKRSAGIDAKIERIQEWTYRVNDVQVELACSKEGLFVKSGNSLFEIEEFFKPRHKKNSNFSEVPNFSSNLLDFNEMKKTVLKNSPSKRSIPDKFKIVQYKPILKRTN
jgi:hypothetical protein